jgi:hypothetical protein
MNLTANSLRFVQSSTFGAQNRTPTFGLWIKMFKYRSGAQHYGCLSTSASD